MALMWPSLRMPSGASFSTLPRWFATHMSPAGHLSDTNFLHGPRCSALARRSSPGGRQLEWSNRRVPWFDGHPAMASAGQMSGSVPVDHHAVRAGQDAEHLVGVLFDEGRHVEISAQVFLAREAREGLGGAGALFASGSAVLVRGPETRSSPPGGTHTSVALALQPFSP